MVDQTILARQTEETIDQGSLLAGLLSHAFIRTLRYADGGPPAEAPRTHHQHAGEVIPGWLVVGAHDQQSGGWPVTFAESDGPRVSHAAIVGNAVQAAESDDRTRAYVDLDPQEAALRRRADALAAQAAASAYADIFITEREFLHAASWDVAGGVLVARPSDALPLVGLYLRSQGEFITYRSHDGTGTESMNKGLYYWVATRELLPSGWRWFSACVDAGTQDDSLIYLGQSVFRRVQRALQARDAAHRVLNQPQNNDTATEALANLDLILLGLMAAVDVTARVAHRALKLKGSEYSAAWQRSDWLRRVKQEAPDLADLVTVGTPGGQTLLILSRLRNSIHGAAMDSLAVSQPGRQEKNLVGLPHVETDQVLQAMDSLGGRAAWGVSELIPHRAHADPGVLLERLLIGALELIDDLMRLTPVERLRSPALEPVTDGPPDDNGIFDERTRKSVRLQLGL